MKNTHCWRLVQTTSRIPRKYQRFTSRTPWNPRRCASDALYLLHCDGNEQVTGFNPDISPRCEREPVSRLCELVRYNNVEYSVSGNVPTWFPRVSLSSPPLPIPLLQVRIDTGRNTMLKFGRPPRRRRNNSSSSSSGGGGGGNETAEAIPRVCTPADVHR